MIGTSDPFPLVSIKCLELLKQALEVAQQRRAASDGQRFSSNGPASYLQLYVNDDDDEASNGVYSSDSSESGEDEGSQHALGAPDETGSSTTAPQPMPQLPAFLYSKGARNHFNLLSMVHFETDSETHEHLSLPSCLFSKNEMLESTSDSSVLCLTAINLVNNLLQKCVIVLAIRSGRLAGAVFRPDGKCLIHRTFVRYTVRKGQGKSQSAQDGQRRLKSVGSQLRRAGEEQLRQDIRETSSQWSRYFRDAALVFVSCPRPMRKSLFDNLEGVLLKSDPRIRSVPLDTGRPTFESVQLIHGVLLSSSSSIILPSEGTDEHEEILSEPVVCTHTSQDANAARSGTEVPLDIPLTPLHIAARNGDLETIKEIIQSNAVGINLRGGEDCMTALHYASALSDDPEAASQCVFTLLVSGSADPTILDVRDRPPYFLAKNDKMREAFRRARAFLGEDYCAWEQAKVGPALSEEDILVRKEKEAEKRRKKRARQKEKKAKEKALAEEAQQRKADAEALAQASDDAKRVRDRLRPTKANDEGFRCEFCQKVVTGRKKFQMFKRLDYSYCSTDCVQAHKRELMAKAAFSRLGGGG